MKGYFLEDLLQIKNGRDHKHLHDGNIPVFGSGGIMRYGNQAIYDDESILLPRKGTLSNIQFVSKPFWTVDTIYYTIINKEKANPLYLYYYLKQLDLSYLNSGTGVPSMTFGAYYHVKVNLPSLDIQQKIAKVLSDLDAKIELNIRINNELEAMAKTFYDYWFVQFDFPYVISSGVEKPYKSSGGKMVWNEELKREIPEGWEVKLFSEWINNDKSGDWGKEQPEGNYTQKVYCIRGADINSLNGAGELKTPERYILEKNLHKTLDPADLIVEISGGSPTQSTGRLAFITKDTLTRFDAPVICSNFCKAVTLKNKKFLYNFVYHWKSIYDAGVLFGYEGKTSGIKNLLFDSFVSSHFTLFPEESIANRFYDFMEPLQASKQKNLRENQELASLRDWLLPMLMNGQVNVGQVEKEYQMEEDVLRMVAEPRVINLTPQDKKVRRKMLATFIVNQSLSDTSFGKTKFEKLLHLIEYHLVKNDYNQRYSVQTAGPYDGGFTKVFWNEVVAAKWFKFEELGNLKRIVAGDNHEKSFKEYDFFSEELKQSIFDFITLFKNTNYEKAEIVSTLYAVWNNRLINNELVNDALLKNDFIAWDKQKARYMNQLDAALVWMRKENIVPDGWGKIISRAKKKK